MNTGVSASKYNFGISNMRCETAAVPIATSSKRKSAYSCVFVEEEGLGFEGHVPRFGGRLFGGFVQTREPTKMPQKGEYTHLDNFLRLSST